MAGVVSGSRVTGHGSRVTGHVMPVPSYELRASNLACTKANSKHRKSTMDETKNQLIELGERVDTLRGRL
jgi:hypothetical protein